LTATTLRCILSQERTRQNRRELLCRGGIISGVKNKKTEASPNTGFSFGQSRELFLGPPGSSPDVFAARNIFDYTTYDVKSL
jgi:hypothetical protein